MELSPGTIRDLRAQFDRLNEQREELAASLAAQLDGYDRKLAAIRELLPPPPQEKQPVGEEQQSRADRIRSCLKSLAKNSSPKEVATELLRSGFKWEGNGDFTLRINSELYRMAKRGLNVKKVKRGKYRYVE